MQIIPQPTIFDGTNTPGIYAIFHKPTGRVYVGSALSIYARWKDHRNSMRRGTHRNPYLQRTFDKYGADSFEFRVLETVPNPENLIEREQHWIDRLHTTNRSKGFNIAPRAGSNLGLKFTPEQRARIGASVRGRKTSEETKRKIATKAMGNRRGVPNLSAPWKLNPDKVRLIFRLASEGVRSSEIGLQVGVTQVNVNRVLKRQIWAHVEIPQAQIDAIAARGSRRQRGSGVWRSILTESQVKEIKARLRSGEGPTAIAKSYGIKPHSIEAIKRGVSWKHID